MAFFTANKKEEKKKDERKTYARARVLADGAAHGVIRAPWFSEKALISTERGVYTFSIPREATKADVAGAIYEIFKVKPKKIHMVNLPGKSVSLRKRRGTGTRARRHKAYVYLHKGDTIQFA